MGGYGLYFSYSKVLDDALPDLFNDLPVGDLVVCGTFACKGIMYAFWGVNVVKNAYASLFIHKYYGTHKHVYLDAGTIHKVDLVQ